MRAAAPYDGQVKPALDGIRVLDIGGIGPGPFCTLLLASLGASVVRLERPAESGHSYPADPFAEGRATLFVDLKSENGKAVAMALVAKADVLIEGYRPGVAERLGLGPEDCSAANPGLIYGRVTGWGQDGPLARRAGHDINYIALSGALHAIGTRCGGPTIPLNVLGDFAGGSFFLAIGLLSALVERQKSGRGQVVDAAIIDGSAALMWFIYALRGSGTWEDSRESNALDGGMPWYGVYETADGKHVSIGAIEEPFYQALLRVMGFAHEELPDRTDPSGWPILRARFAAHFRTRTRDDWCTRFEGSEACFAPVLSLDEAPYHAHVGARGTFGGEAGKPTPRIAPRLQRSPVRPGYGPASIKDCIEDWGLAPSDIALVAHLATDASREAA